MRAICAALLLLTACATPPPPPERVAGCWIQRGENSSRTMLWLPDPERPGVLQGDMTVYEANGATRSHHYVLEPRGEGWAMCHDDHGEQRCRDVARGGQGSLEGGRVFIDAYGETLRISVIGEGPEQVMFRGQRDGCD